MWLTFVAAWFELIIISRSRTIDNTRLVSSAPSSVVIVRPFTDTATKVMETSRPMGVGVEQAMNLAIELLASGKLSLRRSKIRPRIRGSSQLGRRLH
jgi:hypothetical protein